MKPWSFLDYWPREGHNPIREWEAAQEEDVRAEFDVSLAVLAQTPDWLDPEVEGLFRMLRRDEAGIGEIIFCVDVKVEGRRRPTRRKFRVFGILRVVEHDFILLVGSEKQRGTYNPVDAPQLATRYKSDFLCGLGTTSEHI